MKWKLARETTSRAGWSAAAALVFQQAGAICVVLEADALCLVFMVGPHENIYERAERRAAALIRSGRI